MIQLSELPVRYDKVPLRVARGHFATNHSHINYYIDITYNKTRLSEAKATARMRAGAASGRRSVPYLDTIEIPGLF